MFQSQDHCELKDWSKTRFYGMTEMLQSLVQIKPDQRMENELLRFGRHLLRLKENYQPRIS
jgi:hypothetical protein